MSKFYVAGFLYSPDFEKVVLIKKNKPEWQKGCWNAIGGKIEDGESPLIAMRREFIEEAGIEINDWKEFVIVQGDEWQVNFFMATSENFEQVESMTDEKVQVHYLRHLESLNIIPNLKWLIPMCMDEHHFHGIIQANN